MSHPSLPVRDSRFLPVRGETTYGGTQHAERSGGVVFMSALLQRVAVEIVAAIAEFLLYRSFRGFFFRSKVEISLGR